MLRPGDVVSTEFAGATGIKRRPAVVVSSDLYQMHRPDVVLAVITTQLQGATSPTDYVLQDWVDAGLQNPSAFRSYFAMKMPFQVKLIGRISDRDWAEVQKRLAIAIAVPDTDRSEIDVDT